MRVFAEIIDSKTVVLFNKIYIDVPNDGIADYTIVDIQHIVEVFVNDESVAMCVAPDDEDLLWNKEEAISYFAQNKLSKYIEENPAPHYVLKAKEAMRIETDCDYVYIYEGTSKYKALKKVIDFINEL